MAPAAAGAVTLRDAWVKAAPSGMTAVFGTIVNPGDQPVTVVSASSPAAAQVELHEVAMAGGVMKMRPKAGGFTVSAHGTHVLAPGGDHVMLLGLSGPVRAGNLLHLVFKLADGSSVAVMVLAKDYAGANESYQSSAPSSAQPS